MAKVIQASHGSTTDTLDRPTARGPMATVAPIAKKRKRAMSTYPYKAPQVQAPMPAKAGAPVQIIINLMHPH